jgi:hypothetical protein
VTLSLQPREHVILSAANEFRRPAERVILRRQPKDLRPPGRENVILSEAKDLRRPGRENVILSEAKDLRRPGRGPSLGTTRILPFVAGAPRGQAPAGSG